MIKETFTENGKVRGIPAADPRIIAYKGIPYAAAPVGDLRWKAPQPAPDWEGVRDCSRFGPIAMQAPPGLAENIYKYEWNVDPEIEMNEDCLWLNVWTPAKTADEKLPVFVWFFGGGLLEGNPAEMEFNGERIARRGIVVVTINYRVNVFGFLAHPEITAESPDFPTNFGLLDQKFSLEWVKRNIAAFGGDPNCVTIGGQSAGGRSVQCELVSPLTEGLFDRALCMSGIRYGGYTYSDHGFCRSLEKAEEDGLDFFKFAGYKNLAEARAASAEDLRDAFSAYAGLLPDSKPPRKMWAPVIDGNFITGHFSEQIIAGDRHWVPLMMSNTASEVTARPEVSSVEELADLAASLYGDRAEEFMKVVAADTLDEMLDKASYSPMELGMRLYFEAGQKAHPEIKNWGAQFDAEIPGPDHPGTFHSSDLWFVFETLASCSRPFVGKHYDLARQMCNYLCNFIKTGDPNGPDADGTPMPLWEDYMSSYGVMHEGDMCEMYDRSHESDVMKFMVDFYLNK